MAASISDCEAFESSLVDLPKFTISLDKYTWKVNLDNLAAKSGFFAAIKSHRDFQEFKDKTVILHEDEPETFAAALQFIYYGAYEISPASKVSYTAKMLLPSGPKSSKKFGISIDGILRGGLKELPQSVKSEKADVPVKVVSPQNKEVALHLLAQKYCIDGLDVQTLKALKKWLPSSPENIVEVFAPYLESLDVGDGQLKKCLASKIVTKYEEVRAQATEDAISIHGWLDDDPSLLLLVSDARGTGKKRSRSALVHDDDKSDGDENYGRPLVPSYRPFRVSHRGRCRR